ncbi:MAG: DUF4340 domain-containing protein [Planctomycetota bacterium]
MSRLTTLFLLVGVIALGVFAYRQARFEAEQPTEEVEALFKGVDPARVTALRFENLERSLHARIERDARGAWFLTDPLAYPAAPEFVEQAFEVLRQNLAGPVPAALEDRAAAGLEPVRGFMEAEETLDDGRIRRTRVSCGAVDLDGMRVFALRTVSFAGEALPEAGAGRTLRTMRNLETLLERDLSDMRSKRLFRVDPSVVVEVARRGRIFLPDASPSVDWTAQAEGAGWKMYTPIRAGVDADIMVPFTRRLASLRAARFVTDLPKADLAQYGLAPAWFSVSLRDRRGAESVVEFGQDAEHNTYARHPGLPHVYEVAPRDWNVLVEGVDNLVEFMEREFVRVRRDQIADVVIENGQRQTKLLRDRDGRWSVAERPEGEAEFRLAVPAEPAAVERLLTRIENDLKLTYLFHLDAATLFPRASEGAAPERLGGIWVTPVGDHRYGGWIGPAVTSTAGTELQAFLREDEGVVAGLDPLVLEVLAEDASSFLRRIVWDVEEVQLRELTLTHGERMKRYVRGDGFTWRPSDADVPARELRQLLDSILFLKADGEVAPADRTELLDPVRIDLVDVNGAKVTAELGLNPAGVVELIHGVRRARALDQTLYVALRALADGGT